MHVGTAVCRVLGGVALGLAVAPCLAWAQAPSGPPAAAAAASTVGIMANAQFDLEISVRDIRGNVIEANAQIHLTSDWAKYNAFSSTQRALPARFERLARGNYLAEVMCPGFQKTIERLQLEYGYAGLPIYIYLLPEGENGAASRAPAVMLEVGLRSDMERGTEALRKGKYSSAQKTFTKLLPKSKDNPDVLYNLGLAEQGLQQEEAARGYFQRAVAADANHELALIALAQMELAKGATAEAIPLLEKATATGRASWRADYDLASAYLKVNRMGGAESAASRAARRAKNQSAAPTYLLGQIQYAAGKRDEAKKTWESMAQKFPSDALTAQANKDLGQLDFRNERVTGTTEASLTAPAVTEPAAMAIAEHPWAPPDIDSAAPETAKDIPCNTEAVLAAGESRMKSQLLDFEKFTATERIEQQEVDRYGWPGPAKTRDFSYIVIVRPLGKDSVYVEESRNGSTGTAGFDSAIVTTSLNALGVNILQPYYRDRFVYTCEGLAHVRGNAAWQVRFEQKTEARDGVRSWKTNRKTYDIPLKGRIWISSANFTIVRVETDLREAVKDLQLTKDHLVVDYGPVDFASGTNQLWLPWTADMFVELKGKRYHDKHTLTDYLLFAVDTSEKVAKPAEATE